MTGLEQEVVPVDGYDHRMAMLHERRCHLQALAQAHGIHDLQNNIRRRGERIHLLVRRALGKHSVGRSKALDNGTLATAVQADNGDIQGVRYVRMSS